MKKKLALAALAALLFIVASPWIQPAAQVVGEQVLLKMRFIKDGVTAQGNNVLQVGEVSTLSAEVASATRAEVVAAPASGSIYLRGLWINKSTTATGVVTVTEGTGTNCGTGPVVVLSLTAATGQTLAFGYYPLGIRLTAAKALCLTTDAATTGVRALTN